MFTSVRHAGEQVEGHLQFSEKKKASFVSHALRAVAAKSLAEQTESPDALTEAAMQPFDFRKSLEAVEMKDLSSAHNDHEGLLFDKISEPFSVRVDELEQASVDGQEQWDALARVLQQQRPQTLQPDQFPVEIELQPPVTLAIFSKSTSVVKLIIEERQAGASNHAAHLLTLVSDDEERVKYIYKEDAALAMNVATMELFRLANYVWEARKCPARIREYHVVATLHNCGFVERLPGATFATLSFEDMVQQLGKDAEQWEAFYGSLVAVMCLTAAFDVSDRSDANMLFTSGGDIALLELGESLGHRNALDKVLQINSVYFPERMSLIHQHYRRISEDLPLSERLGWKFWDEVEEDVMVSYFALFNNYDLRCVLKQCGYRIPSPMAFHTKLDVRRHSHAQRRDKARTKVSAAIDESVSLTKVAKAISKAMPDANPSL